MNPVKPRNTNRNSSITPDRYPPIPSRPQLLHSIPHHPSRKGSPLAGRSGAPLSFRIRPSVRRSYVRPSAAPCRMSKTPFDKGAFDSRPRARNPDVNSTSPPYPRTRGSKQNHSPLFFRDFSLSSGTFKFLEKSNQRLTFRFQIVPTPSQDMPQTKNCPQKCLPLHLHSPRPLTSYAATRVPAAQNYSNDYHREIHRLHRPILDDLKGAAEPHSPSTLYSILLTHETTRTSRQDRLSEHQARRLREVVKLFTIWYQVTDVGR